jgi:hypothetical protein
LKAVEMYEKAPVYSMDNSELDRARFASICKNKSVCYRKILEYFEFTTDDPERVFEKYFKMMIESQNKAIWNGREVNDDAWFKQILESSKNILENENVEEFFDSFGNTEKIGKYEAFLHIINPMNYSYVVQMSSVLQKLYFEQSVQNYESKNF